MTTTSSPFRIAALALLAAAIPFTAAAAAPAAPESAVRKPATEDPDGWKLQLAIPSWLAATSGTIGLDGVNSHVYMSAETLIKHLDMIATFSADVRKGRFGFYSDFLYVSASDGIGNNGLVGKLDIRLDQYLLDMDLYYRVLEGPRGFLDLRAGVRYTNIYNKLTISPNDDAIDDASVALVNGVSDDIRKRLAELDLRGKLRSALEDRIRTNVTEKISGVGGDRPALPIAPVGARRPGRMDEIVRVAVDRRVNELAAALRAREAAATAALREAAQRRIDAVKSKIAKEVASKLRDGLDTSFSLDEQWWDPYVGFRAQWNINHAFYLKAKADIGGFGIGSDLTWQASGALGCQISRHIYAELGYRYLYTDYDKNNFVYKVTQSGVEITAGINF